MGLLLLIEYQVYKAVVSMELQSIHMQRNVDVETRLQVDLVSREAECQGLEGSLIYR